jgi:hypothetical protein
LSWDAQLTELQLNCCYPLSISQAWRTISPLLAFPFSGNGSVSGMPTGFFTWFHAINPRDKKALDTSGPKVSAGWHS